LEETDDKSSSTTSSDGSEVGHRAGPEEHASDFTSGSENRAEFKDLPDFELVRPESDKSGSDIVDLAALDRAKSESSSSTSSDESEIGHKSVPEQRTGNLNSETESSSSDKTIFKDIPDFELIPHESDKSGSNKAKLAMLEGAKDESSSTSSSSESESGQQPGPENLTGSLKFELETAERDQLQGATWYRRPVVRQTSSSSSGSDESDSSLNFEKIKRKFETGNAGKSGNKIRKFFEKEKKKREGEEQHLAEADQVSML
jgi:hypothetical protein